VRATDDAAAGATTAADAPAAYTFTHRQVQTVLLGLMAGSFLAALDQTIVATALPRIVGDFGGVDQLAWIASIYLLTSTAAMPLVGKLSDLYGRRLLFQVSIVVFMVGSLVAGLSQSMAQLIAARAIQGLGAGGLVVLNFGVLADIVAPRERGKYQGYVASVWAVASVLGPVVGGFFVDNLTWRWIFLINLPIGVVALLVTSAVLKLPRRERHAVPIDYLGATLLVAAIVSLLLVTEWGGERFDWWSAQILGLVAVGIGLGVAFVIVELRAVDPIIPPRLFRNFTVRISASAATVFGMLMFGTILFVPVYFQIVRGDNATNAGLLLLPQMIGILTSTIAAGRLTTRTGRYKIFPIIGLSTIAVAYFVLSRIEPTTSVWVAIGCMMLAGAGIGMTTPALMLAVQNIVPTPDIGSATSMMTTVRSMGASVGAAVLGAVLTGRLDTELASNLGRAARDIDPALLRGSPEQIQALPAVVEAEVVQSFADALSAVFLAAVPIALVSLVIVCFLPEVPLRTRHEMVEEADPTPPLA
jgi:EmrB/QacA subfamily drug resistance transporter